MKRLIGLCFLIPLLAQGAASVISQPSGPGSHSSATNVAAADITDATATGIALMTAADAAAGRVALEAVSTNNPTTTGTFTHNGTNAIMTPSNAVFNVGKANALVIDTNGNVGLGKVPVSSRALDVTGTIVGSGTIQSGGIFYSSSINDATAGNANAAISTSGGGYFAKGISSAYSFIRSNAPSTAAARGANTLIQEFNTNQWRVIATGPTTNEMVLMTLNTNGLLTVPSLTVTGTAALGDLTVPTLTVNSNFVVSRNTLLSVVTPDTGNIVLDFQWPILTYAATNNIVLYQSTNRPASATNAVVSTLRIAGDTVDRTLSWHSSWKRLGTNITTIPSNKVVVMSAMCIGPNESGVTFGIAKEE